MSTMVALTANELRLYAREWGLLVFALVFPPLMMLVLAGVFASDGNDAVWGATSGTDYYIASYVGVPLASAALTGLPVMLAGYRELGILRRFAASGIGAGRIVVAQAVVCLVGVVAGGVAVLAVAAAAYGVPAVQRPAGVLLVFVIGAGAVLTLGIALGLACRSVRVANAAGMLVFFPMFILGGGGPPVGVMPAGMRHLADALPLARLTEGLRKAWLYGESPLRDVSWLLAWWAVGLVLVALAARARRGRTGER